MNSKYLKLDQLIYKVSNTILKLTHTHRNSAKPQAQITKPSGAAYILTITPQTEKTKSHRKPKQEHSQVHRNSDQPLTTSTFTVKKINKETDNKRKT